MSNSNTTPEALPEMQQSMLDSASLEALIRDISQCATLYEVIPKFAADNYVGEVTTTLPEGFQLLREGKLRALQIRYSYEGKEWWDTLMHSPNGIRLIRIQHDFGD